MGVTDEGKAVHEFTLGDEDVQAASAHFVGSRQNCDGARADVGLRLRLTHKGTKVLNIGAVRLPTATSRVAIIEARPTGAISAAQWDNCQRSQPMKRRTLDILFSSGGIALAGLLLILGLVMTSNANFAKDYTSNQLSQQKITFKTVDQLTEEEAQSACVVANAGKPLITGKQAECYANEFIGLHVKNTEGANGMTYAELGGPQGEARTKLAAAQASNDPAVPALEQQLADITKARETLFKGETLRGLLLTSYGFSEFGTKGDQVSTVAFTVAGLLFLLSIAGFVHAFRTPRSKGFAIPEPSDFGTVDDLTRA